MHGVTMKCLSCVRIVVDFLWPSINARVYGATVTYFLILLYL